MATWPEIRDYVHRTYVVRSYDEWVLTLNFQFKDGRTQLAIIGHHPEAGGVGWLRVLSVVGPLSGASVDVALRAASGWVCGGLTVVGDELAVEHWAPLASIDANEVNEPLQYVISNADRLEQLLFGVDAH